MAQGRWSRQRRGRPGLASRRACPGCVGGCRGAGCLAWRVACVESRGVPQQRGTDAAESSPEDDAGVAGLEAAVLELPGVSDRAPATEVALRPARITAADARLVAVVALD